MMVVMVVVAMAVIVTILALAGGNLAILFVAALTGFFQFQCNVSDAIAG